MGFFLVETGFVDLLFCSKHNLSDTVSNGKLTNCRAKLFCSYDAFFYLEKNYSKDTVERQFVEEDFYDAGFIYSKRNYVLSN